MAHALSDEEAGRQILGIFIRNKVQASGGNLNFGVVGWGSGGAHTGMSFSGIVVVISFAPSACLPRSAPRSYTRVDQERHT